jgi:hypothetical protein
MNLEFFLNGKNKVHQYENESNLFISKLYLRSHAYMYVRTYVCMYVCMQTSKPDCTPLMIKRSCAYILEHAHGMNICNQTGMHISYWLSSRWFDSHAYMYGNESNLFISKLYLRFPSHHFCSVFCSQSS